MSQSHTGYIPIRYKCVIPKNTKNAISLPAYAAKHHVHVDTVRYWLKRRKVTGYKVGGQWYINQ